MVSKTTVVKNPSGIHARPASLFVQEASKYESSITVGKVGGDAKAILMVMSLGMICGCEIVIAADGADEAAAVDALVALVESGCGE